MSRAILPLVLGAILGGAAVYVWNRSGSDIDSESSASNLSDVAIGRSPSAEAVRISGSGYRSPGNETANNSFADTEFESLLARAGADPESVLSELADMSPPARQREVALTVLAALGNDDAMISRVAAMLPEADRLSFRIDALATRAQDDPLSALRSALALDISAARNLALPRIAEVIASLDPTSAIAQASLINDRELKALYLASAAATWAEVDAPAALAWLETAVPSVLSAVSAAHSLEAIAARDHELLFESLDQLSPALKPVARRAAILALAERDPRAALAEFEALGAGRDVMELEAAVAERYALQDPAAAVEWAMARPESQSALEGALRGAAAVDYRMAVDLAMQILETEDIRPTFALVESAEGDFSQFANRLLASEVPEKDQKFQALMIRWPQVDAEAALAWTLDHADQIEQGWLVRLTLDGGREYPELAIAVVDRVPPDIRDDWIAGIAGGIAANDIDRAIAFLEQHRGEPGYDQGLASVADSMTSTDPIAAARFVDRTGARAAGRVGWAWAQQDPVAASDWVASLEDPEQRRDGISNLAANWSRTDPNAAITWLLDLPDDPARDWGIQTALQMSVLATGSLDRNILDEIGDEQMRTRAAVNSIVALGRSNADEARRLVDELIEDPGLRQQALQRIAEQSGGPDAVSMFSSGVDIPR
jgi:hypothetical protein